MGLIKAALGAAGGALADTWRDYFYCESLEADVLVEKGEKRVGGRSSNTKGTDNIISNGSIIAVANGQCMIIVDQGKVVEVCAEPGEFVYDTSTEPSIFYGSLGDSIKKTFSQIGKRITFGGDAPKDQRVYYVNTKEIVGNKYGTPSGIPFRIIDNNIGLDMDMQVHCFGEYSYKITDPILFYTNVCGNVDSTYERSSIDSQLKTELLTALAPAFGKISASGVRYSELSLHTSEIADALNEQLSGKWANLRGIQIVAFGVSSANLDENDQKMIKDLQQAKVLSNVNLAAGFSTAGSREAATIAAGNEGGMGAMGAFMGMNMAQNQMGGNAAAMFAMGQQQQMQQQQMPQQPMPQQPQAPAAASWTCSCGNVNTGKFCSNCGSQMPAPANWTCSCGTVNTGNFCSNCGSKRV